MVVAAHHRPEESTVVIAAHHRPRRSTVHLVVRRDIPVLMYFFLAYFQ
jgi:hypothetical protein